MITLEVPRRIFAPLLARHLPVPHLVFASLTSLLVVGILSHVLTIETVYGVIVAVRYGIFYAGSVELRGF